MTVRTLEFDHLAMERQLSRDRTGWTMSVSVLLHALLIFLLIMMPQPESVAESLTQITLVDPGQPDADPAAAPAGAAAPAPAGPIVGGEVRVAAHDEHFLRRGAAAISPDPQSNAMADQIDARLATMRDNKTEPAISGAATGAPSALWSAPAGVPNSTGASGTHTLSRGEGLSPTPALTLGRGASLGSGTSIAADVGTPKSVAQAAAAPHEDASVHRSLAGAMLTGPVANRPVLHMVTPVYPDWAKHDGVEATVTLSFVVRPDGVVTENVLVQKTAGFADFDDNARAALQQWRFQPLPGGQTGEQWGTITFRYRLRDS